MVYTMLTPIDQLALERAPTFREAAYYAIKQAILNGSLEAGQPLVEERLAEMLQISRTPVREALAILEHEGLIAPVYRRGLFVCKLTREQVIELFTANEAVEPFLARRAAHYASPEQTVALESAICDAKRVRTATTLPGFARRAHLPRRYRARRRKSDARPVRGTQRRARRSLSHGVSQSR